MRVLHHIKNIRCVNGCPQIILAVGLVADEKLQFSGLHAHLTSIVSIYFCGDICKPKCTTIESTPERNCDLEVNDFQVK
jgi:hypothetical protein